MNSSAPHILLVEDDTEVARLVTGLLEKEGYRVTHASNGAVLDDVLSRANPDIFILDVMLPGEDGLSICRRLRRESRLPILMLTAKSDEIDRVLGLEMGADDYLVKPFGPRELIARIRALLRRASEAPVLTAAANRISFEGFVIDFDVRLLSSPRGEDIPLTAAEFDLLTCFVKRPRRVLSRDVILDFVHGRNADPFDRSVDMLVSRLRKKLDGASGGTSLITTIRNSGYIFTAKDISAP